MILALCDIRRTRDLDGREARDVPIFILDRMDTKCARRKRRNDQKELCILTDARGQNVYSIRFNICVL